MAQRTRKALTKRGQFWLKHVLQWKQAGCTQTRYCQDQAISLASFRWWRKKLLRNGWLAQDTPAKEGFVELSLPLAIPAETEVVYEVHLPNRRHLRVPADFSDDAVSRLITLLESTC